MRYEVRVDIDSPPSRVWAVLTDVERWPEWTTTMTRVQRLNGGAFDVGSTARVEQPRLPTVVWQVVDCLPGRSFTWSAGAAGVTTDAAHEIEPRGDGCTVRLAIHQRGPLAPVAGLLLGGLTRRYVDTEAASLKRRCEQP